MVTRFICLCATLFVLLQGQSAIAQARKYLTIDNNSDGPAWVLVKPSGRDWGPAVRIGAGREKSILLRGNDPYEIIIVNRNHEGVRYRGVKLRQIMERCAEGYYDQLSWNTEFGALIRVGKKTQWVPSNEVRAGELRIDIHENEVTIPVFVDNPDVIVVPEQ